MRVVPATRLASIALALLVGCGRSPSSEAILPEDPKKLTIRLRSDAFADGGDIPKAYTCDGKDTSPPLEWSGVPGGARSLALVVEDPDALRGTWAHWILFDLAPDVVGLPGAVPGGETFAPKAGAKAARQGKNDFGHLGYGGPCPPSGTHRYVFRLYALDGELALEPGATREQVLRAMNGHVLAEGRLTGRYRR
jgi:Raf kinase inhibitor-like YbhB/YbcL family protein